MNNNSPNSFNTCVTLSQNGDKKSLQTLIKYSLGNNSAYRKSATLALKKTHNQKLVTNLLNERISNTNSPEEKNKILSVAFKIQRKKYLYRYLQHLSELKIELSSTDFFNNVNRSPLNKNEQLDLKKYILKNKHFDNRLISLIDSDAREDILYEVLTFILENGIDINTSSILLANKNYLNLIQDELRNAINSRIAGTSTLATYLDCAIEENQKCFNDFGKLSVIYNALHKNIWELKNIKSPYPMVNTILKICQNKDLQEEDWFLIKENISDEMKGIHDASTGSRMLFVFLNAIAEYDFDYVEKVLIQIDKKTRLYSKAALNELGKLHSEYSYREILKIILTTKNESECFHYCVKLVGYFPERENSIIEYAKVLDDSRIIDVIKAKAMKIRAHNTSIATENNPPIEIPNTKKCTIIKKDIVLSELLFNLANQINATEFYSAVGFAFASGLKMLSPIFNIISKNSGKIELIIGSLQNYTLSTKNKKMDKTSAEYINTLIQHKNVTLFTYKESFYHGKFYYIGNSEKAFIIIGSSNISKTAFLDNNELDILFEVDKTNNENAEFLEWFTTFKEHCIELEYLDLNKFDNLNWNSELDIYASTIVHPLSLDDIKSKLLELTDEDLVFRLNLWLEYKPSDYYSNLGITALKDYIAFLYPKDGIAVFESFIPGNAYYVFEYYDFEQLLNQVSPLTKTQMMANMTGSLLDRGIHIHDKNHLRENIALLFQSKPLPN